MKTRNLIIVLIVMIISSLSFETKAQTPFTNTAKAKYVKTTVDTFSIPGVSGVFKQGFITNQSATLSMNVMFSKRDGSKDTSSRVVIPAGKTLHFNFVGTKIFRYAVTGTDSVYSQVIIGDVKLNYNDIELKDNFTLVNQTENVMTYIINNECQWTYTNKKGFRIKKIYAAAAAIKDRKKVLGRSDYFWGS